MASSLLSRGPDPDCAAILVAAGKGVRAGAGEPKQFRLLGGVPVLARALRPFVQCGEVGRLVLVVPDPAETRSRLARWIPEGFPVELVEGGPTRQESTAAGLAAAGGAAIILVHDGVRPFVEARLIRQVAAAARRSGAAAPLVAVRETLKQVDPEGRPIGTVSREGLALAQTPQGFRRDILEEALAWARQAGVSGTDEAEIVERSGHPVARVEGSPSNIKITTAEDFETAERLLGVEGAGGALRVGIGYDVHALVPGRAMILGGVSIPHACGPAGHSDGDLVCHAATDAILGAAGQQDIGQLFPDTDPAWRGAASLRLLEEAALRVRKAGFRVVNLDLVVVTEEPRLVPHLPAMRANLARALDCPVERIGIKGKRGEGLGFAGRREGMAAHAVALLVAEVGKQGS